MRLQKPKIATGYRTVSLSKQSVVALEKRRQVVERGRGDSALEPNGAGVSLGSGEPV